ncbi:MAG TPA: hypothetical protein VMX77_02460 [Candidatus Bathyarchaeia archaeon]|nr:hypothetical protein [Candidatus Bathyarchaeia archaeon]
MIILHGENIVASRKALENEVNLLRQKGADEKIFLDGTKLELGDLKQALESTSLLGQSRLVVIENLLTSPKSKRKEAILDYLKKEAGKIPLILWEPKEITKKDLNKLAPQAKATHFKISPLIFKFVDSLSPQNKKASLDLFHQCLKQDSPEMVFYMVCRQIRLLIIAQDLGEKGLARLYPWQQSRLVNQSRNFSQARLLKIHQMLLLIDYQQKTGKAPLPLASQLDLLIAGL